MNLLMVDPAKIQTKKNYRHKLELDAEFVASIKQHGIIEPLIVRTLARGKCELVAGARRLAAAKKLKLKRVPCIPRDKLTEAEAIALGVVENTQRLATNLLEESEAIGRMLAEEWDLKSIALHLGRSVTHVQKVVTLERLSAYSKKLVESGELTLDAAFQLARLGLTAKDEKLAADQLAGNEFQRPRDGKVAADQLSRKFMLRLKDAPFDVGDAELLAKAGSCSKCPKRSGQQQDLFGDVKAKDVCLDRACYEKKCEAFWARLKNEHPDEVLDTPKELFAPGGYLINSKFVDLDSMDYSSGKQWRNVVPKDAVVLYARDLEGKLRRLAKKPKVAKKREADASFQAQTGKTRDEAKAQREKRKANRVRAGEIYADCVRAFAPTPVALTWMLEQVVAQAWRTTLIEWLIRNGESEKTVKSAVDMGLRELVLAKVEKGDLDPVKIMFELLLCTHLGSSMFDEVPSELTAVHLHVLGFADPKEPADGEAPAND